MSIEMDKTALGTIPLDNDLEKINIPHTKEYVFGEQYLGGRIELRVYTTISTITHEPRSTGKDAIRVLLYDKARNRIIDKAKRTHRTKNWRKNLKDRVRKMREKAEQIERCNCGGILVPRNGFFGCTKFPECDNTKKLKMR